MAAADETQVAHWLRVLALSRLDASQRVVVLSGPKSHPANLEHALQALARIGAQTLHVTVPHSVATADRSTQVGWTPLQQHTLGIQTLKFADLVIDLVGLLHSPEQLEILASGTRMLMVLEPPELLAQMLPELHDKERVMAADRCLREGRQMHVTSAAGTDLQMTIGVYPTLPEYGFADEPGHWDHWPSGFTSTWPKDGSAQGRIVIDVGDMLFPFKMYVGSPISMEIQDGRITSIDGGFEARYLRRYMEAYRDPDAFAVSHVGWGLQPKARWHGLGLRDKAQALGMDARAFYGNFLFSTGPNSEAGGPNRSQCHVDIPMAGCSVSVDGEWMVRDGDVVAPDQKVGA